MRRTIVLSSCLGVLAVVLLAVSGAFYFERPTTLRVAVSSSDGADDDLIGAAGRLLRRGHHGLRLHTVNVDGVAAAAAALDGGIADLAVVRADVATPASGETVVLLHKDVALLITWADSAVETIGDLRGKRVGMLSGQVGDSHLLEAALAQYDVEPDTVIRVSLTLETLLNALKSKSIDAVFVVGQVSEGLVPKVVKAMVAWRGAPVFLPVAEAAAIADRLPEYQSAEVARGAFGGAPPRPPDEFETLGVTYRLVANAGLSQGVVASLTRFLLSERVALAQIAPMARRMEAPSTDKGSPIPVHPGTAAYIDDEEESFLDRYSDVIYIGAMALGVIASGMTAIVGRLGLRGTLRSEDLVTRLLDILKLSREAPSAAVLDDLDDEVVGIVASGLDEGCRRGLDERRIAIFNMAVEQVRAAIRDRRDVLRVRLTTMDG